MMNAGLEVLMPGLHTTVQDLGRVGYQDIGVPVSGALDPFGLRLANALVGNPEGMAALEVLMSGPSCKVAADSVRIALVGAGARLEIGGDGARTVAAGQSVRLGHDQVFRVLVGHSACCYLAVEGGLAVPLVLGSVSTYVRAALGGLDGRALRNGDVVPLAIDDAAERAELRVPTAFPETEEQPVRVILGPQHEYFRQEAIDALFNTEFRVSKDADRMGLRLDGPLLRHRSSWDIASDAIATGSIQVPGSGQPIVLLADHQTTGGYPKIATVISVDLPVVGRRRPGDPLRFVEIDVEAAEQLCREEEDRFAALIAALEPVAGPSLLDVASLYRNNLISGVTTGLK